MNINVGDIMPVHTMGREGSGLDVILRLTQVVYADGENKDGMVEGVIIWMNPYTRLRWTDVGDEVFVSGWIGGGVMHNEPSDGRL